MNATYFPGPMSDCQDQHNDYENIGQGADDDGWGSSEFEEYEDDQRSIGTQSQNSPESAERAVSNRKNLFRRKIPARLSRGKSASDVQSIVSCNN